MMLTPNALSPSVQKTATVMLIGNAARITAEAWSAHLQVRTRGFSLVRIRTGDKMLTGFL